MCIFYLFRCIYAVSRKNYTLAYAEQNAVVQGLIKVFQTLKDENWLLPVMNTVCLDLRLIATKVDMLPSTLSSGNEAKPREALEKAAETLMACFRICTSDKYVYLSVQY